MVSIRSAHDINTYDPNIGFYVTLHHIQLDTNLNHGLESIKYQCYLNNLSQKISDKVTDFMYFICLYYNYNVM